MISVTLPAGGIPDGETVRKPTGTKKYLLRRELIVYGGENGNHEIVFDADVVFLVAEGVMCIDAAKTLTIDFETVEECGDFIDLLVAKEEMRTSQ